MINDSLIYSQNGDKPGAAFGSDVDAATQQEIRQLVRKRRIEPQQEVHFFFFFFPSLSSISISKTELE